MLNRLTVLDHGYVELVDKMGSDLTVVNSARVSFNKESSEFTEKDRELLRYLLQHRHTSPMRHAMMTFRVKAPIFVLRQWMKHRIASEFNEVSSRYVDLGEAEFYHPKEFRAQAKVNKQGSEGEIPGDIAECHSVYENALCGARKDYKTLRKHGVAKEQARCVMPVSQYSEVFWTVSLEAALHFLSLRLDSHAQWEIREYAKVVRMLVQECFPVVVSEYEAIQKRSQADKELADWAVKLALADIAFELNPTPEAVKTLDSVRADLRSAVGRYSELYSDDLKEA